MNAKIIVEVGDGSTKIEMHGSTLDLVKGTSMALWSVLSNTRKPGASDAELMEDAKLAIMVAAMESKCADQEKSVTRVDSELLKNALEDMGR